MESIWNDIPAQSFPPLRSDVKTDVLIIGGGMAGMLCACYLIKNGVDCIVAEARTIGSGTTRNTTAKVTAQHGLIYRKLTDTYGAETAALYLQANHQAVDDYRALTAALDCDWKEQDSFIYATDSAAALEAELNALISLHYPARWTETLPLPFSTAGAVMFPGQGQLHPMKLLTRLAESVTVYENTPVQELRKGYALTGHGRIFADSFVVATHFPFLNRHGSYFMKLYQQRTYVLALENTPPLEGMYLDARENGLSFRQAGNTLLLGGCGHRTGKPGGGWRELETYAHLYYPRSRITHRWAAQDCMSLDAMPYIGQYSKNTPNVYVATGFNKWGMTGSMVAANILKDLVQRKPNDYAAIFSPSRNILHRQLLINLGEAAKNLLTPTVPRCPHLGCALKWNAQEHSWDCPCHGSRFTESGRLIDNPATGDLKRHD